MNILGIETSCDETAVALFSESEGLLAHEVYSQVKLHAEYGGVVPELASRDHIRKCLPLVEKVMASAKLGPSQLQGIAYTRGPGLVGALMVGACIGRTLGWAWQLPTLGIHHLEAHLLISLLEPETPKYPFLSLLVSGGHTLLIRVEKLGNYQILGETLDDAVGEAFDKTANLLGLGYPGGAKLSELAKKGDASRFKFPRPMIHHPGFDFSFSGLKTFAANCLQRNAVNDQQIRADIACAFQTAAVESLWIRTKQALHAYQLNQLVVVGVVSANWFLRRLFQAEISKLKGRVFFPRLEFSTDNAAMVAYTGYLRFKAGQKDTDLAITVDPRWSFDQLPSWI